MTVLLTILGVLLLLISVAGLIFGGYVALNPTTRGAGLLFALWWVSAVVAALGILIRDPATFVMGLFCFTVAGLALFLKEWRPREPAARRRVPSADSERIIQENKIREPSENVSEDAS